MIDKIRMREYVRKNRAKLSIEQKQYLNLYYTRSWKAWIGRRVHAAIAEDKLKNREYNINTNYIMQLLEENNYKCILSGLSLTHDCSLNSMSIDRIDNKIGHCIGNVQLVSMGINLAKNYHTNTDVIELLDNLLKSSFIPIKFSRDYLSACRRNTLLHRPNSLSTDNVVRMFEIQGGCCVLTGIKLAAYKHPVFAASIDRINNDKGYEIDNIRLIIKSMNRARGKRSDQEFLLWLNDLKKNYNLIKTYA